MNGCPNRPLYDNGQNYLGPHCDHPTENSGWSQCCFCGRRTFEAHGPYRPQL